MHGPAKSPTLLEICSPDSAKADAHWLIACSDAPAHTISRANTQKTPLEKSLRADIASSASCRVAIGTCE